LKILIVENNVRLLNSVFRFLNKKNFEVFTAKNGEKALEIWAKENKKFDIALIDIFLPDANGLSIAEEFRAKNPGVKILLTSAHIKKAGILEKIIIDGYGFLQKPYKLKDLLKALKKLKNAT